MSEKCNRILFVDACVREGSRTRRLAEHVLAGLEGEVTRICPADVVDSIRTEAF